jgi:hypothetical protein
MAIREGPVSEGCHESRAREDGVGYEGDSSRGPSRNRSRRRRPSAVTPPTAVAIGLFMIVAAYLFIIAPPPVLGAIGGAGPDCVKCPDGTQCEPNCGTCTPCPAGEGTCEPNCAPPCNPTITPLSIGATVSTNPTNATITITVSPDLSGTTADLLTLA